MKIVEEEMLISPFLRYSGIFYMQKQYVYGPRICYVPSLYYIVGGKGQLIIESETYDLKPGMQIYIEQGKRHTWLLDPEHPITFKYVYFEWRRRPETELSSVLDYYCDPGNEFRQEMLHPPIRLKLQVCTKPGTNKIWSEGFDRLQSFLEIMTHSNDLAGLKVQGYFLMFLDEILEGIGKQLSYIDPRIAKVMKRIEENNLSSEGTLEIDWRKLTGLNRSRFYSLFKSGTGLTPKEYWNWCRMNEAKKLLRTTPLSITEIAELMGYAGLHSFSKSFTRTVGKNPSQYRMEYRIY